MISLMVCEADYEYILIREAMVLVRIPRRGESSSDQADPVFFDVRTGVQLPGIQPPLQSGELERGHSVPPAFAASIIGDGAPLGASPAVDLAKVVSILDLRQRKLDGIVADSVLDQLRTISDLLRDFLAVADDAQREERFWLSQQVLTFTRKFSGRELAELRQIVEWFRTHRGK
jgi:hypothetical protein